MFTIFFTPHPVTDFRSAKKSNPRAYARFFHGVLTKGVYLAPSQFEANFLSTVHGPRDLHRTVRIFERVLAKIF
jgi:glutamate-1-semialdehyde 2,1-aminomutase